MKARRRLAAPVVVAVAIALAFLAVRSIGPVTGDSPSSATGGPAASSSLEGLALFRLGELDAPAAPEGAGGPPFIWPVDGWITQFFAWDHAGVDIGVEWNEPVRAARDGTVVFVGGNSCCSLGLNIVIEHDEGWSTLYAHLNEFRAGVGDVVRQGDVIGIAGSTGHSTGPHVHLELHYLAFAVDPMAYFPAGIEVRLEPDATETPTEAIESSATPIETPDGAPSPTEATQAPPEPATATPPPPIETPAPPTPEAAAP